MHALIRRRRPARRDAGIGFARIALVAQALTAVAVAIFIASGTGVHLPFVSHSYEVVATVPDAAGLDERDHPRVTVAGVKAGRLEKVRYDRSTGAAVLTLALDTDVRGKLFADARVRLGPRSTLNDLVADIDPGSPAAGSLRGNTISRAAPAPVGYDRVLGVLDSDTRAYTQILVGTLREMLADRPGALRAAIDELPDVERSAADVATTLAARRRQLTRLVDDLAKIAGATGRRGRQLTRVVTLARRTLDVTARRGQELGDSIRELPATLDQTRASLRAVRRLAVPLVPALNGLRPAARQLPAALREVDRLVPVLEATTGDVDALARRGRAPLRAARGALTQLGAASRELRPAVPTLEKVVRAVADNQDASRAMLEYWPGAISSNNTLAPVTRAKVLDVLPVAPGAVGLPGSRATDLSALRRATTTLARARPELFRDSPAGEPLPIRALRAAVTAYCLRHNAGACSVLGLMQQHRLRMLSR